MRGSQMRARATLLAAAVTLAASGAGAGVAGATPRATGTPAARTVTPAHAGLVSANGIVRLLASIDQSGTALGRPTAKITATLYGDLECPLCRDFVLGRGLSTLITNDVRSGKVRLIYRSFCTATCAGPGQSVFHTQQIAAYAAGQQHRFWQYAMLFLDDQGAEGSRYVTESFLDALARQVPGLDYARWLAARGDPALNRQVNSDEAAGNRAGIVGTPTIVFQGPNGKAQPAELKPDYRQLEQAVRSVS